MDLEKELYEARAALETAEAKGVREGLEKAAGAMCFRCSEGQPVIHPVSSSSYYEFTHVDAANRKGTGQCWCPPAIRALIDAPTEEPVEDTTDVRVVRPLGRGVLGSEEAHLVSLSITDDRDTDYIDPRLKGSADLVVNVSPIDAPVEGK